jgi:hypothetical protein
MIGGIGGLSIVAVVFFALTHALRGLVVLVGAANPGTDQAVVTRIMPNDAADNGTPQTSRRVRRMRNRQRRQRERRYNQRYRLGIHE